MKHLWLSVLLLALPACEGDELGSPTGSTCPPTSTLTYASFGQGFMDAYCTSCHSSAAESRHGAPNGVNFDTQAAIGNAADEIDRAAAAGPEATNTIMPPLSAVPDVVAAAPSDPERQQLAEWLACGAP